MDTCKDQQTNDDGIASANSFTTEKDLAHGGFRGRFRIFNANQHLVQQGIARTGRTTLVEFLDKRDGQNSTGTEDLVRDLIDKQSRSERGIISVSESWTDEALRYLRRKKHSDPKVKMAALNYANCYVVGGNYSDGGMVKAQEEELCRLFPALFDSMKSCEQIGSNHRGMSMCEYKEHKFGARFGNGYAVARNVLFTEEVQCLRGPMDMNYRLLQNEANRVNAGFVEAAAPLFNRGHDYDFQDWRNNPKEWYEKVFLNVFWAPKSIDPSYDVIVVGPWGCGAFGNDPEVVAQSFINVIKKHRLLFLYKEIHFCLGRSMLVDATVGGACNRNVTAFRNVLDKCDLGMEVEDDTKKLQSDVALWLKEELQHPGPNDGSDS